MSNISIRELQLFQLRILKELDRICKKCNIEYTLAYGSCLGAVRHKGFIPWDDDIDVQMTIDNYNKFTKACRTELGDEYYFSSHEQNVQVYVYWNRIGVKNSTSINRSMSHIHMEWGVCIDIFPIFVTSKENLAKTKGYVRKLDLLSQKYYHVNTIKEASGSYKIKKIMHKLFPDYINLAMFRHYLKKVSDITGDEDIALVNTVVSLVDEFDKSIIKGIIELPFEDTTFPCVKDYDAYLKRLYGDYMRVPDTIETHTGGDEMLVILDEPYTKYLN